MKKNHLFIALLIGLAALLVPGRVLAASEASVGTIAEFQAAAADATVTKITLTADLDFTSGWAANSAHVLDISGKTIDLGGHTITANNYSLVFQGTGWTITNGTFDGNGGSYAMFIGDTGDTNNAVIDGITCRGGINVFNATVTLRNGNVSGTGYYAVWCDEGAHVTIESGSYQTAGTKSGNVIGMAKDSDPTLAITGGDFKVADGQELVLQENGANYGKPTISGGEFNTPVDPAFCADSFKPVLLADGSYGVAKVPDTAARPDVTAWLIMLAASGILLAWRRSRLCD